MKKSLVSFILLAFVLLHAESAPQKYWSKFTHLTPVKITKDHILDFKRLSHRDWLFILDTSGSMNKIFVSARSNAADMIANLPSGDRVTVLVFDTNIRVLCKTAELNSVTRSNAVEKLMTLWPTGKWTYLREASLNTKDVMRVLSKESPLDSAVTIWFSDCINDVPSNTINSSVTRSRRIAQFFELRKRMVFTIGLDPTNGGQKSMGDHLTYSTLDGQIFLAHQKSLSEALLKIPFYLKLRTFLEIFIALLLAGLIVFVIYRYGKKKWRKYILAAALIALAVWPGHAAAFVKLTTGILELPFFLGQNVLEKLIAVNKLFLLVPLAILTVFGFYIWTLANYYGWFKTGIYRNLAPAKIIKILETGTWDQKKDALIKIYRYGALRSRRAKLIKHLRLEPGQVFHTIPESMMELHRKDLLKILLRNFGPFSLIMGKMTAGRSMVINGLIGCPVLPEKVESKTWRPTMLHYGNDRVTLALQNGKYEVMKIMRAKDGQNRFTPDKGCSLAPMSQNEFSGWLKTNFSTLLWVDFAVKNNLLHKAGTLIDTPSHGERVDARWMQEDSFFNWAKKIMYVLDLTVVFDWADIRNINYLEGTKLPMVFAAGNTDKFSGNVQELKNQLYAIRDRIDRQTSQDDVEVIPVSSVKMDVKEEIRSKSGYGFLMEYLKKK